MLGDYMIGGGNGHITRHRHKSSTVLPFGKVKINVLYKNHLNHTFADYEVVVSRYSLHTNYYILLH